MRARGNPARNYSPRDATGLLLVPAFRESLAEDLGEHLMRLNQTAGRTFGPAH